MTERERGGHGFTAGRARPEIYEIAIEAHLDRGHWSGWFEGMQVRPAGDGTTVLSGDVTDQPKLQPPTDFTHWIAARTSPNASRPSHT